MKFMISAALILASTSLLADPIFVSQRGQAIARELMWGGRLGTVDGTESAAFVVDRGDGEIACLVWPANHQHLGETFYGGLPPRTIAIFHTHPRNMPMPSSLDQSESSRLGIPIYVLTPRMVTKAEPSSPSPVIVHRGEWFIHPTGSPECRLLEDR